MPVRTLIECSICHREMRGETVEVRVIVSRTTPEGLRESCRRYDVCSPACGLTAARQQIEGAWDGRLAAWVGKVTA